jgi:uncharacterized protein with FMN-binding domain
MSRHSRGPGSPQSAARLTRARRVVALGGMLAAVGGLVTVRATLTPSPHQALGSSGLAAPVHGAATSSPSPARTSHAKARPAAHQQLLGNAYDVSYGIVQVRVTLNGKRITDITPVSLPQGGRSGDISGYAAPQLRREALSAQSAHIDAVSGASYTSAGYARSLQSALDKAAS